MSDRDDTGSATDLAIAKIKELISSGEFTAGARLPTERELTQRFGVSRSSLREAVRALALIGVLESRVGDGTYVTTLEPDLLLTGIGFVSDLASGESLLEIHARPARCSSPRRRGMATPRLDRRRLRALEQSLQRDGGAQDVAGLHRGRHRLPPGDPRRLRQRGARVADPEPLGQHAARAHLAVARRAERDRRATVASH